MAIGDPILPPIPTVGTLGPGYATAVNAFLTEVKTRLENKVPFSSLLASGTLDMLGRPLANAQYVGLAAQSVAPSGAPAGRIEYYNGELYVVTTAGTVQITSGGALAVTSAGGIGGDYGGANPAQVRFVDADQRYDFYDDFGGLAWGYVRALGFDVAAGATSTLRARIAYGGAGSYVLTLPATLPASNRSLLQVTDTGQVSHNEVTAKLTNPIFTSSSINGDTTASISMIVGTETVSINGQEVRANDSSTANDFWMDSDGLHHDFALRHSILPSAGMKDSTAAPAITDQTTGVSMADGGAIIVPVPALVGDRITSVTVAANVNAAPGVTVQLWEVDSAGVATSLGSTTVNTAGAWSTITLNSTDHTLATGEAFRLRISTSGAVALIGPVNYLHTRP